MDFGRKEDGGANLRPIAVAPGPIAAPRHVLRPDIAIGRLLQDILGQIHDHRPGPAGPGELEGCADGGLETLGIREGTSKAQLFRAREMLRAWLTPAVEVTS